MKFILFILFLAVGFFLGTAWQIMSDQSGQDAETTAETYQEPANPSGETTALPHSSVPPAGLNEHEKATIRLFEKLAPSVAYITTSRLRQDFWSRNVMEIPQGSGSGFVWDKDGHIITNYHVIQDADRAQVTLADQTTWDAKLVGKAPEKDLAVLKIEAPRKALRPIPIGGSSNLKVGQNVYAIGNPFGLDQTLTTGIISALGREIQSVSDTPIRGVIQTDAAINPGNSGGPLLNSSGKLIGVNTAIYSPSGASAGIGFSIPVDEVRWVVPELIAHGKIMRPSLGIEFVSRQTSRRLGVKGALIFHVIKGSAAEKAGLKPTYRDRNGRIQIGDSILAINEDKVVSSKDLILILEKYKPGDKVTLKVLRDKREVEIELWLDEAR